MVLLGGLEFVAAGYVLKEISKDNKKKNEEKERRERKHDRKHHHRHDSPHLQSPPQHNLRPPQFGPPRPSSAPPPSSHPMAQLQPLPGHPQHIPGHPQQWQPATRPYHPIPLPQPRPNMYPPPGVHIDMKTGQVQYNMLPPDMQPHAREGPPHAHQYVSNDDRVRSESDFYAFDPRQSSGPHSVYSEQHKSCSQPQINPVASPRPGYPELDAETPGRYAQYDMKDPRSPPPGYRE